MQLNEQKTLCVAIHDVAPATWPDCLHLLSAIREVADIPITWLVVPHYHGSAARSRSYEAMLGQLAAHGHELALHGYTHLDTQPDQGGLASRLLRNVYTKREGEFAAMGLDEARRRIELGLAWFHMRGWPVNGFVAPAWLLSAQAWQVVRTFPFEYTTTWSHFHFLQAEQALLAPALMYAARNRSGRFLSPPLQSALAWALSQAPMVRLALHPRDARYPALVRHAQHLIARALQTRTAMTKAAFVQHYQYGPQYPPKRQGVRP